MVRAPPCHGGGRGFESHPGRLNYIWKCGILAQLGEHLPYKQRVIGSSPIGPIKFFCWCGGIGRRKGLKILREQSRAGSSPATSTKSYQAEKVQFCIFFSLIVCVIFSRVS